MSVLYHTQSLTQDPFREEEKFSPPLVLLLHIISSALNGFLANEKICVKKRRTLLPSLASGRVLTFLAISAALGVCLAASDKLPVVGGGRRQRLSSDDQACGAAQADRNDYVPVGLRFFLEKWGASVGGLSRVYGLPAVSRQSARHHDRFLGLPRQTAFGLVGGRKI